MAIHQGEELRGKGIARFGRMCLWSAASAVVMMLAACASNMTMGGVTVQSPPEVKQKVVKERALARWQAVIRGDAEKAYEFLSAGSKAVTPYVEYRGRARLTGFQNADLTSAVCEADSCKVRLTVILDHKLMKTIPIELEETWELEKGQYWYVWRP